MFGSFRPPFELSDFDVKVFLRHEGTWTYRRSGEKSLERVVTGYPLFHVHPIEPLQLPSPVARALYIKFEEALTFQPNSTTVLYLTFPLEVGVFLDHKEAPQLLDVLSLTPPRMTLYGERLTGLICRYHSSAVYFSPPDVEPMKFGILKLEVHNLTHWETLSRVVLPSHGMKLFFKNGLASMFAIIKIQDRERASVECLTRSFEEDADEAIEVYPLKRLSAQSRKLTMEGLR